MKINKSNISSLLIKLSLLIAVVASTAYLLMLGWHSTLLLDDYGFVSDIEEYGIIGYLPKLNTWGQCRYSAFLVLGCILTIWGHASNLVGYTIMMLLLGYAAMYYALRNITRVSANGLLLTISILVTNISIMAYLELSTFYWVCCAIYTLSTYAAIALFTAIFFSRGSAWARWLVAIVCSLYLCGGAENFTPILIASLAIILLCQMIRNRDWRLWKTEQSCMALVCLLILCAGFIIGISAQGTHSRAGQTSGFMSQFALIPYLSKLAMASGVFLLRLLSRCQYYVLLFPLGMILSAHVRNEGTMCSSNNVILKIVISFSIVAGLILLSLAASVYGVGWYAPLRAYSFVSFLMAALFIYWGIVIGCRIGDCRLVQISVIVSAIVIAGMSVCYYRIERPLVANVHAQIANCNNQIIAHRNSGNNQPIVVPEVKYPNIPNAYALLRKSVKMVLGKRDSKIVEQSTYFPYERYCLTKDPHDWRNTGVQGWAHADFDIIGWAEPEE